MDLVVDQSTFAHRVDGEPLVSMVRHPELAAGHTLHRKARLAISVAVAVVGGVVCGFAGTSFLHVQRSPAAQSQVRRLSAPLPAPVTQTVVPVTYDSHARAALAVSNATAGTRDSKIAEDLESIKARNRRLEALVKVLRRRDANDRRSIVSTSSN